MLVILNYPKLFGTVGMSGSFIVCFFAYFAIYVFICLICPEFHERVKGIHVPMFQNLALCVKFVVANNIYIFAG